MSESRSRSRSRSRRGPEPDKFGERFGVTANLKKILHEAVDERVRAKAVRELDILFFKLFRKWRFLDIGFKS
tara:strand:+ start:59 stop:274 length:216 start_codon:yes stop_codon:yes gene_type:complete